MSLCLVVGEPWVGCLESVGSPESLSWLLRELACYDSMFSFGIVNVEQLLF